MLWRWSPEWYLIASAVRGVKATVVVYVNLDYYIRKKVKQYECLFLLRGFVYVAEARAEAVLAAGRQSERNSHERTNELHCDYFALYGIGSGLSPSIYCHHPGQHHLAAKEVCRQIDDDDVLARRDAVRPSLVSRIDDNQRDDNQRQQNKDLGSKPHDSPT